MLNYISNIVNVLNVLVCNYLNMLKYISNTVKINQNSPGASKNYFTGICMNTCRKKSCLKKNIFSILNFHILKKTSGLYSLFIFKVYF